VIRAERISTGGCRPGTRRYLPFTGTISPFSV